MIMFATCETSYECLIILFCCCCLWFQSAAQTWTATPKPKGRGYSPCRNESTLWTLWLIAPPNVTLKQPSHASTCVRALISISGIHITCNQELLQTTSWRISTGLSCLLKRTKSVGLQKQTLKQSQSCAEAAQLYMKKKASACFIMKHLQWAVIWFCFTCVTVTAHILGRKHHFRWIRYSNNSLNNNNIHNSPTETNTCDICWEMNKIWNTSH